jgi:hypothetical protein
MPPAIFLSSHTQLINSSALCPYPLCPHTCTHTHSHAHKQTHTHTHTRTHAHTLTHTHTHTHTHNHRVQIAAVNPTARFTCLADAGHFLHHNDKNGGNSTSESFKTSYYGWNSTGGTNQACVASYKPTGDDWKCIFAQYVTDLCSQQHAFLRDDLTHTHLPSHPLDHRFT